MDTWELRFGTRGIAVMYDPRDDGWFAERVTYGTDAKTGIGFHSNHYYYEIEPNSWDGRSYKCNDVRIFKHNDPTALGILTHIDDRDRYVKEVYGSSPPR